MYGDIIPPLKKKHVEHDHATDVHFSHIDRPTYRIPEEKNSKNSLFLFLLAALVISVITYYKIYGGTTFDIAPKTTRIEIQERIPLILQSTEKDTLTYSLVYVPEASFKRAGEVRNPFSLDATTTKATTTTTATETESKSVTISATSTKDTKNVRLINISGEVVPLRINTRFAVGSSTYTLDSALDVEETDRSVLATIASGTAQYKVIGFAGSPMHDQVYAVPEDSVRAVKATIEDATGTETVTSDAVSTIPPPDVLALMPDSAIPLLKSTIYDKVLEQSAIVVFDSRTLEEFLNTNNVQAEEYFKALKPFGPGISYKITVIDYTLVTSPETGKPTGFSSLILELTPKFDAALVPQQFAGFKRDVMDKIAKQVAEFADFDISYTPFWAKSVADEEKIKVHVK